MALDGAKFICLSDATAEDAETTPPPSSTSVTVAGKVAGNSAADATPAESNTVIAAKGRKFTVGYYMSCDYVLDDERAEGEHCEILCDAFGRVTIHNISKSHPISVNGQVLTLKRPLLDGSRITILDKHFLWKFPKSVHVTATGSNKEGEAASNKEDETSTPQKVAAPEQAPNSCPDLKPHRKLDKRFTVHNFAYCINSDEEGNTSTDLPSINESDSVEEGTTSTETTEKKEEPEQTETKTAKSEMSPITNETQDNVDDGKESNEERRSITPEPQPHSNASTLAASTPILTLEDTPKTNLINCTKNKENKSSEKNRRLISLCQQSDLVITSFSPRETGVRIEKSFTAVLKPIAATTTTPKSVYSTPKSLIYDSNDEGSRDFIDFTTPATSKKAFGARLFAGNSSMHLIDLTTPSKLAPSSTRQRATGAALKRNQTLPTNVKLSTTPLMCAKLDAGDDDVEAGINALPVTPKVDIPTITISVDTATPQSAESVISVDGSSSDLSTHVIEISTEDSTTPSISSPARTNLVKPTKTPQRTGQKPQITSTPQRTQTPSLMKRALLTSAKKNANTTNRASPARPRTPATTPIARNIKLVGATTDATASTSTTPKSSSRIAIGSPSGVAAAQRRFVTTIPRRSMAGVGSPTGAKSSITTSTPLNPRQTQTRNLAASAPRLSLVKRTSPLHRVRKSVGGVTLSSHISKTRHSVVSPKKRSPTAIVTQQVTKARKTLCMANANRSRIASRSRSLVAAAVSASTNKAQTAVEEKRKQEKSGDLSRTFTMDDDSLKESQVEESKLGDASVAKATNVTFSPVKTNADEPQQELNKTFSPEKPGIRLETVEVEDDEERVDEKNDSKLSESLAEAVAPNGKPQEAENAKLIANNVTKTLEESPKSLSTNVETTDALEESINIKAEDVPLDPVEGDDSQKSQDQVDKETIAVPELVSSSDLTKQIENKNTEELNTSEAPLSGETCKLVEEAGSPKPVGESQGTADLLEEIEYVLNKSDELQQQLGVKDGYGTSESKDELKELVTENESNMVAEVTTNVKNLEQNTKVTELPAMNLEDDDCLSPTSSAVELPTASKIIFSVQTTLEVKHEDEDKTSIDSDIMHATFEIGASSDIDGSSEQTDNLTITTNPTPSEFEVSSIGGSSADVNTEKLNTELDAQENINTNTNPELNEHVDDLKPDLSNEVSSTEGIKEAAEEDPKTSTGTECAESKQLDTSNVVEADIEEVLEENEAAVTENVAEETQENPKENQNIQQEADETKRDTVAELYEVELTEETAVELTADESVATDTKLAVADTEEILEKCKMEDEVPKVGSNDYLKTISEHKESQTTTEKCPTEAIEVDAVGVEPINSDEEKENKKVIVSKMTKEPLVDVDSKTTTLEPKTPNFTGIRDMLRTPKRNTEAAAPTTPRTIGLRNLMRTPKASTSAAANAATLAEDDEDMCAELTILPKTPQQSKQMAQTPQSTVENFTPRRSARRRASANPDLTPTRCQTPITTLDASSDVMKSSRTTRRRASATAEMCYTPQRITRRRSSLSLDNDEAVAASLTPQKRGGSSSLRAKRTPAPLILECPEAEDMGAIIEEETKDDVEVTNDSKQNVAAVKAVERIELKSIEPSNANVIEDSICEEIVAQKMPVEQLEDIIVEETANKEGEKQSESITEITKQAMESVDSAQAAVESAISIPISKLREAENDVEDVDIVVNPTIDAEEISVLAAEPTELLKPQAQEILTTSEDVEQLKPHFNKVLTTDEDVDKTEAKLLDKSDYDYGKEVEENEDTSTIAEQPKTPKTNRKTVRIADHAMDSPKTPVMVGMRELMKTPKDSEHTPKLIGVRDLMRTPKVVVGLADTVDDEEQLKGLADLVKTPKTDKVTAKNLEKEIVAKTEEPEEPSTSNEARTAFIGMRELLKTPKHTSTPQYRGMRELLRTPKACSTPQLAGLEELMQTPKRTKLNDKYDDDNDGGGEDGEGLDQFFKTPRAKHVMIPGDPASAVLEPSTDGSINIMTATTEYDLHSSHHEGTIDDIYKTPVSSRLSNVDTLTEEDNDDVSVATKKDEESEVIVPETPAQAIPASTSKRNIAATEAFDELDKSTTHDTKTPQKVFTRKSHLTTTSLLSPFSATDIITDLPKSDIQEWVDNLQQSDELEDGEQEEREVTVSTSILNAARDATHDPIAASLCEISNLTVNKDTTEQMLADMSAVTTSDDPLLQSATKHTDPLSHDTAANNENETLRPATPNEADISGINLLDQTNESVFSEPLVVSDIESLHDDSQENDESSAQIAEKQPIASDAADNNSQDEEEFPTMFVESSDSEHEEDEQVTKTPANTTTPAQKVDESHKPTENKNNFEKVDDTVVVDLDDSNAAESALTTTATKTNATESSKDSDIHIEFTNFQAHKTIASQQIRASTPNRSTKARTTQSAQGRRRQSLGAEKKLGSITIDLTHEKSRLVKEKAHQSTIADCIIEVDESIDEVIAIENDENVAELNENKENMNEDAAEVVENTGELVENAVELIKSAAELNKNVAELNESGAELIESTADLIENATELNKQLADLKENKADVLSNENAGELNENAADLDENAAELNENADELSKNAAELVKDENTDELHKNAPDLDKNSAELNEKTAEPELEENVAELNEEVAQSPEDVTESIDSAVKLNEKTAEIDGSAPGLDKNEPEVDENVAELNEEVAQLPEGVTESIDSVAALNTNVSELKVAKVNENVAELMEEAAELDKNEAELHKNAAESVPASQETTVLSTEKINEEFGNFQANTRITTRGKRAATPDQVNKKHAQKISQAPRRLTLGAEKHLTGVKIDFSKEKSQTQKSEQLTEERIVESLQEVDEAIDEVTVPEEEQCIGDTIEGTESLAEIRKPELESNIDIICLDNGNDLEVEVENSETKTERSKENSEAEQKNEKAVDDNIIHEEPASQVKESVVTQQTKPEAAKVEFNENDIFDLTEEPPKDPPAVNTTQGVIFDLTEEEEDSVVEEKEVRSKREIEVEGMLKVTSDEEKADAVSSTENGMGRPTTEFKRAVESISIATGVPAEVKADNANVIEISDMSNVTITVEQTGSDLRKADTEEFMLMTSMESEGDIIEISEEEAGALNNLPEEDKQDSEKELVEETIIENEKDIAVSAALTMAQDTIKDKDVMEITENSDSQVASLSAIITTVEQTKEVIDVYAKQTKCSNEASVEETLEVQISTEEIVDKTVPTQETEEMSVAKEKSNGHHTEAETENEEKTQIGQCLEEVHQTPIHSEIKLDKENADNIVEEESSEMPTCDHEKPSTSRSRYRKTSGSNEVVEKLSKTSYRNEDSAIAEEKSEEVTEEDTKLLGDTGAVTVTEETVSSTSENAAEILEEKPASTEVPEESSVYSEEKPASTQENISISEEKPANSEENTDSSEKVENNSTEVPAIVEKTARSKKISEENPALAETVLSQPDESEDKMEEKVASTSSSVEKEEPEKRSKRKTSRSKSTNENKETLSEATCESEVIVEEPENIEVISIMTSEDVLNEPTNSDEKLPLVKRKVRKPSRLRETAIEKDEHDEKINRESEALVEDSKTIQENQDANTDTPQAAVKEIENEATHTKEKQEPAKRSVRKTSRSKQTCDDNKDTISKASIETGVIVEEVETEVLLRSETISEKNVEELKLEGDGKETSNEETVDASNEATTSDEIQAPGKRKARKPSRSKQTLDVQEVQEKQIADIETQAVVVEEVEKEATTSEHEKRQPAKRTVRKTSRSQQKVEQKEDVEDKGHVEVVKEIGVVAEVQKKPFEDTETQAADGEKLGTEATSEEESPQPAKRTVRKTSRSKQNDEQKEDIEEKTQLEVVKEIEVVEEVQEKQDADTETQEAAIEEVDNKEKPQAAKRTVRKTSRSKQKVEQKEDIEENTQLEVVKEIEDGVQEKQIADTETQAADVGELGTEATSEEVSPQPAKRTVRKTSRSKQNDEKKEDIEEKIQLEVVKEIEVVQEVQEKQDADTERQEAVIEEVDNKEATSEQENPQAAKRTVRKTSHSKQKVEQKEKDIKEKPQLEDVKETVIVDPESTESPTTALDVEAVAEKAVSEQGSSAPTTEKIEETVEATTSTPAKRRGRKPSRSKQIEKDNKLIVEERAQNAEKEASEVVAAEPVAKQTIAEEVGEAVVSHVKVTYEVSLLAESETADKNATADKALESANSSKESDSKTETLAEEEPVTVAKVLDEAGPTDMSHKQEPELHTQRPTRRGRKGSASSQCSQDDDHLPTTKRRGGRRRAEAPVENSADEASTHDEASTTTKRRRGQGKATQEVIPQLEEIKEVELFDDSEELKEQDDVNVVENKTAEQKEKEESSENVNEKQQQTEKSAALSTSEESTAGETREKSNANSTPANSEPLKSIESSTEISVEVKEAEASAETATGTNTHDEEVNKQNSGESATNTKPLRRAGRRKLTVSESSQTSSSAEPIGSHTMQRGRRKRKPTTEEAAVDTLNEAAAATVGETTTEETPTTVLDKITEKGNDMKAIKAETKKETHEEEEVSSSAKTVLEMPLEEKKEDSTEIANISTESSAEVGDLQTKSQKENIADKEEEQTKEETNTAGRKRVQRRKKADATEEQTEKTDHKEKAETHTKTRKLIDESTNAPVPDDSVGGRRGRRGAAAAATVAINEVASAHKRGTPRAKSQQNTSPDPKSHAKEDTKKVEAEAAIEKESTKMDEVKVVQKGVRRKRRGSIAADDIEKVQQQETEVESTKAKKGAKSVRKRHESLHAEDSKKVHEEDDTNSSAHAESPKSSSTKQQRTTRKRKNSLQSLADDEVTTASNAGGAGDDEPPKKRPLSRKRRDSSLDSSIHEVATSTVDGGETKASSGNTSSASTTPNRPRRAVAAEERNYDESSDAEAQVELKRRIEKASRPKVDSNATAATTAKEDKSARSTPVLSAVLTKSRGGRQRKPTARVQQYLEEERAKAETPKRRLLLAGTGGAETPSTSQARNTPARRTRKASTVSEVDTTEAQQTPARGRQRNLKTLTTTATETSEESRSDMEHAHSEHETTQSTTGVEEKDNVATSKAGKRTAARRGKQAVSAAAATESDVSEAQEAPTTGRSGGRAAKAAAAAALITDDQPSSAQLKPRAVGGRRGRRGAHADTVATDDEQHTDVETKDEKVVKKSAKSTKTAVAPVEQKARAGRGGRGNKRHDAEESEASIAIIDADDEHEEEEDDEIALVNYVDNDDEEEDKPLAKVKKSTKKRPATSTDTASRTESPAPKRGRGRRGVSEKDAEKEAVDTAETAGKGRKVVRFDGEAATSSAAAAPATRATRSRRK